MTLCPCGYCILVYCVLGEVISYALPVGPVPALTSDPAYLVIFYPSLFGPGRGYELCQCLRNRFLHSGVTLCTRRYCILVYSVLGEVISSAKPWGAMPCLGSQFLHSSVTLRTRRCFILICSVLGELISYTSYALLGGPVPTLTSDPAYLVILYHR